MCSEENRQLLQNLPKFVMFWSKQTKSPSIIYRHFGCLINMQISRNPFSEMIRVQSMHKCRCPPSVGNDYRSIELELIYHYAHILQMTINCIQICWNFTGLGCSETAPFWKNK